MQVEDTRVYRVKAVAGMLDVTPTTIYRAIQAGELDAYKVGTGNGALRIPGSAIRVYLNGRGQAARDALVTGGADAAGEDGLTPAQADGLACVVCGVDYLEHNTPRRPVGRSHTDSQVFACCAHRARVDFAPELDTADLAHDLDGVGR